MELPERWPSSFLHGIKELIRRTRLTDREHGAVICYNEEEGIVLGETCEGDSCSVPNLAEFSCPPGFRKIGDFHTHPTPKLAFSDADIAYGRMLSRHDEHIMCLGSPYYERILCAQFSGGKLAGGALYELNTGEKLPPNAAYLVGYKYTNYLLREQGRRLERTFRTTFKAEDEVLTADRYVELTGLLLGLSLEALTEAEEFCLDLAHVLGYEGGRACVRGMSSSLSWLKAEIISAWERAFENLQT